MSAPVAVLSSQRSPLTLQVYSVVLSFYLVVMLQPFDCDSAEKNKHKFMIQSMVIEGDTDVCLDQFVSLLFFTHNTLSGKMQPLVL